MRVLKTLSLAPSKMAVIQKEVLARCYSNFGPVYLVNEYPKSGGTWLKLMLAKALDLPAWTKNAPIWGSCVMQAHWTAPHGKCRTVALFRDGRDVMVSYYYHSFFRNEFQNGAYTKYMRDRFKFTDLDDIRANLLPFMKVMIDAPVSPAFSWIDFVRIWGARHGIAKCRYEDLRRNTAQELVRLKHELTGLVMTIEVAESIAVQHSMANMRQRKAELNPAALGQQVAEKSFIRQGSVGGWDAHFTDEALEWFENKAGQELKMLGYNLGRPDGAVSA